ncbi:c-type cytochrome [Pedobacter alpinus]|uniref:C-type cytochrome n=1 Tax=Pedobacter alpinus TaxID=1590643 RepID=A0ABW5TPL5_9SPHI
MNKKYIFGLAFLAISITAILSSCHDKRSRGLEFSPNMYYPLAYNPDQKNKNFADGITAQVPPVGTTPVGYTRFDDFPNTPEGYAASDAMVNPLTVNKQNLAEGQQLYIAMCGPCHGKLGMGNGHIVEIGKYPAPPSYSTGVSSRGGAMKDLSDGKINHTIQYGLNLMGSYASQLSPEERWQVVMYVRELQKAQ